VWAPLSRFENPKPVSSVSKWPDGRRASHAGHARLADRRPSALAATVNSRVVCARVRVPLGRLALRRRRRRSRPARVGPLVVGGLPRVRPVPGGRVAGVPAGARDDLRHVPRPRGGSTARLQPEQRAAAEVGAHRGRWAVAYSAESRWKAPPLPSPLDRAGSAAGRS